MAELENENGHPLNGLTHQKISITDKSSTLDGPQNFEVRIKPSNKHALH